MYESQRNEPWRETVGTVAARTTSGYAAGGYPSEHYTSGYEAPTYQATPYSGEQYAPQGAPAPLWYEAGPGEASYGAPAVDLDASAVLVADVPTLDPDAMIYPMRNKAGTGALVLGVFALICTSLAFVLFPLGIIAAVWAIVLGRRGRFRARYGFASNGSAAATGLGLGIVALLFGMLLSAGTAWVATSYDVADFGDCVTGSTDTGGALRCAADVIDAG